MPIKASSARRIDALLADLRSDEPVAREAAVARLMVIGERAVDRLAALAMDTAADSPSRTAALRALEGIGHPRALEIARRAVGDADAQVAGAAVGVARSFLNGADGLVALDTLTATALDRARPDAVRESALSALGELDRATLSPVVEALLMDPSARLRAAAQNTSTERAEAAEPVTDAWFDGVDGITLPDDPALVRQAVVRRGKDVSLPRLHLLIERIREREPGSTATGRREWMGARAAAHVALATRGSRLAIYDLRESLDAATEPLPVEFLAALTMVGDASCLEPLAGAYARATDTAPAGSGRNDWWQRHLAEAFQAIVSRDAITRRQAVAKKIEKRWPSAVRHLWPGTRSPKPEA